MKIVVAILCVIVFNLGFTQSNIKVGEKAPEIHITDWIANIPIDKDLSNKNIVLEFWATWCGPCIAAVPHMNELQKEFENEDLYYISITDEEVNKVERTMKRVDFQSIVVSDQTQKTHIAYGDGVEGLEVYPLTVLISKSGTIQWIGEPMKLNPEVMTDFLVGKLTSANGSEDESNSQINSAIKEKLSFRDLMVDKDLKFYFDLEEVEADGLSSQTMGTMIVRMKGYSLRELYSEIFEIRKAQISVPAQFQDKKYLILYKNMNKEEGLVALERNILEKLGLRKVSENKMMPAYLVSIADKSKLEKTLNPNTSSSSDAGDRKVFTGKKVEDVLYDVSESSSIPFIFQEKDDSKYDFIIKTDTDQGTIESLKSYGLSATKGEVEAEFITLTND